MHYDIYGIDPGIVHTGVVKLSFDVSRRMVSTSSTVIAGLDPLACANAVATAGGRTFIEGYKPRSHFSTDQAMVIGVREIHKAIPGSKVLLNTGVKKVVLPSVMKLFGMHTFRSTHHQDLESAGRILLLGMYKDPELNRIVYDVVHNEANGRPWAIHY